MAASASVYDEDPVPSATWLAASAASAPQDVAIWFEGETVTYRQLSQRAASVAAFLLDAGVGSQDRVVFCGLNRPELFETFFACTQIGAVFVPLNNRLTVGELSYQLRDCDPTIAVVSDGFGSVIQEAGPGLGCRDIEEDPIPDHANPSTMVAFSSPEDPALMVYTSGTTGQPKGAVLSHRALWFTAQNSIAHQNLSAADCVIAPLPTFHVGGLNIQSLPTLLVGGSVVLMRRFDPGEVLTLIDQHRPSQTLLVPAMLQAVAAHPRFAEANLECLIGINTGSSVVPEAVTRPYTDRGVPVGQVYGATETGPTAVVLDYSEAADHPGSCGRAAQHTEVRVVDSEGVALASTQTGELWLRGPHLFSAYWGDSAATDDAHDRDWYRTGDVGHVDDDGYVYISDRLDDMIISGGENVYPAELEAVLVQHPSVAEVAVIGRPDPTYGQVPEAVVVLDADAELDLALLRHWCQQRLARYKQPRALRIVDELPRTALGKVQKHLLRSHGDPTDAYESLTKAP